MASYNTKDFIVGTIIGSIVGASTALLLTPKSGEEWRQDLSEGSQSVKQKSSGLTSDAYEKGSAWAIRAKDKSSALAKNVSAQSSHLYERVKGSSGNEEEKSAEDLAKELNERIDESEEAAADDVKQDVRNLHKESTDNNSNNR